MSKINPVDIFFSKGNINALYGAIQSHLTSKYNITIGRDYLSEMLDIMKIVVQPIKRVPKNINIKEFVTTLNKQTLREAIPVFEKSIQGPGTQGFKNEEQQQPQNIGKIQINPIYTNIPKQNPISQQVYSENLTPEKIQQFQQAQLQSRPPNMQGMSLPGGIPQPSFGGSPNDNGQRQKKELDSLYEQIAQDRTFGNGGLNGQQPQDIDFTKFGNTPQLNDPKFNTNIDQLYAQATNYRQKGGDVAIAPPNMSQLNQLPFQKTEGFQLSNPPIYQVSQIHSPQFHTSQNNFTANNRVPMNIPDGAMSTSIHDIREKENSKELSVDNIYSGTSSSGGTFEAAFNPEQFTTNIPRIDRNVTYPVQTHDYADAMNSMNSFNPIAPQPQQMRTLIPKTSRNTVTADKSNIIPVNISIDSRNKDPTKGHNSYRIEIDEVRDVLSIELTDAQIPISEYSVNTTNNVIYFEETDGDT